MSVFAVRTEAEVESEAWLPDEHHLAVSLVHMDLRTDLSQFGGDLEIVRRERDVIKVIGSQAHAWMLDHLNSCGPCEAHGKALCEEYEAAHRKQ